MSEVLLDWYREERARIYSRSASRAGDLLIGTQVWDKKYLDRFARYLVPTMMAPANLAALSGRARMLIYTRAHEVEDVWKIVRILEANGIEIEVAMMPPLGDVKAQMVLGTIHSAMMTAAGHWMMGLHATYADHLYSERYFPNLFRLIEKHPQGICHYSLSCQLEGAAPAIEKFRSNGSLAIPAADLGTLAFQHQHQQTKPFIVNDLAPGRMSPTAYLVWRGMDRLWLHCPHTNPVYLSPIDCLSLRTPNVKTVVAALDLRCPYVFSRAPYVPTIEDNMQVIEVSDVSKEERTDASWEEFAKLTWAVMRWRDDFLPFWTRPSVLAIREHDKPYVEEEEARRQFAAIFDRLMADRERLCLECVQEAGFQNGWRPTLL